MNFNLSTPGWSTSIAGFWAGPKLLWDNPLTSWSTVQCWIISCIFHLRSQRKGTVSLRSGKKKKKKKAKYKERDFPGGAVDKNLPANGEDMGSISEDPTYHRGTKPSHRATKPVYYNNWRLHALKPVLYHKRSHCNEKPVHINEEQPSLTAMRKSLCKAKQRPSIAKHKINKI